MKDYFKNTEYISNSQLRNFVNYDKWGNRILTPDIYKAYYIDKTMEFEINDSMIVGKIVDKYFDGEGEKVWEDYEVVSRRTGKSNKIEITKTMEAEALKMIEWGKKWTKFQDFINDKNTKKQVELKKEIDLTDENGEIHKIKIKGLPDFINENKKLIVDLKTSGSIDMIIDSLQFKGEPIFTANYIRQLSMYNQLLGGGYDGVLALITTKGVKWIDVPNWILEKSFYQIEQDLIDLHKFIKNPSSIDESIFKEEDLEI